MASFFCAAAIQFFLSPALCFRAVLPCPAKIKAPAKALKKIPAGATLTTLIKKIS